LESNLFSSNCASRYEQLSSLRENFLHRARECAKLTLPPLIPESGHNSATRFYTPYQGIGSRGVNNLAARLLLSLLPPNTPFFKLEVSDADAKEIAKQQKLEGEVQAELSMIERAVMDEIEREGLRAPVFEMLKHLIVGGNALFYLPASGGAKVYGIDKFVCVRDAVGNLLEVIIKEEVSPEVLSADMQALLASKGDDDVALYTKFYLEDGKWLSYQDVGGEVVPGSEGSWPADKPPMMALRWNRVDGEDYGRGFVEEYIGDLISLEGLSRAILEASAAAAKVVFLVAPNGTTRVQDLAEADSGDFRSGNAAEVSAVQLNKQADMAVASATAQAIEQRLGHAFMLFDTVARRSERTTAYEVREAINALEVGLGGVFSMLSNSFQLVFVRRLMERMQRQNRLDPLQDGIVAPSIVTGTAALGRANDLQNLQSFFQFIAQLGPQVVEGYLNMDEFVKRTGAAIGIDMNGLVKSGEQREQEEMQRQQAIQQQQAAEIAKAAAPQAVSAANEQYMESANVN